MPAPPSSSGPRGGRKKTNGDTTSSSATPVTTLLLRRASVLVALLAVAVPSGRTWWQQQRNSLDDRHAVLEVAPACQFERRYRLGAAFDLAWANGSISVWPAGEADDGDAKETLWYTYARDKPFVLAARAEVPHDPIQDGHYFLKETILERTARQTVDEVAYDEEGHSYWRIVGTLAGAVGSRLVVPYRMTFHVDDAHPESKLRFEVALGRVAEDDEDLGDEEMHVPPPDQPNRILLRYGTEADEGFFGFGEHFSRWNLKGALVPVLISEQGVGRGLQPLTFALNFFLHGVGADWHTTYVAKPLYLTSRNRALGLAGPKVALFDLRHPRAVTAEYWSAKRLAGALYKGRTPLELIEAMTTDTGRMTQPLPAWTQRGVVVGLEGGSDEVEPITEALLQAGVPLVGVWLQDWVGTRHDWDGTRLVWNWELDEGHYPRWGSYREALAQEGVRLLTYINPYLVDVAAESKPFPHRRNLFAEAVAHGYLIKNASGAPLLAMSGSIEFGTVDASNPGTRAWLKRVIAEQMVGAAGASGWMADFGEYVPFGAQLHAGQGNVQHNAFPDHWVSLQREAVAEAGGNAAEDVVVFVRSGHTKTPGLAQLYWVGDQLVTWDAHDGIKTAVLGMLSGGLVGHSLSSSDVGGYTMIDHALFKFFRPKELLLRWVELGAFLGVFYRTHLGSFMHTPSAQVWDDAETIAHLARFGRVFAALAPYRAPLMADAAAKGHPVVRAAFLHYPDDPVAYTLTQQFLLGADLLVAPVLDPGRAATRVYLPREGEGWRHVWSHEVYEGKGEWVTLPSPMGAPPVLYRVGSPYAELFDSLRAIE